MATPPQASEQLDSKQSDGMKFNATESEAEDVKEDVNISLELPKEVDPLDKFLPPPPKEKCSDELQVSNPSIIFQSTLLCFCYTFCQTSRFYATECN